MTKTSDPSWWMFIFTFLLCLGIALYALLTVLLIWWSERKSK